MARRRQLTGQNAVLFEPLAIGLGRIHPLLDLIVRDDPALFHVHQEHTSRAQATLLNHIHRIEIRDDAHFRRHDHEVVVRHVVAAGAQSVAVQHGADLISVGEGDGGWTIPWLHHAGVVFVKSPLVLTHEGVTFPWFGNNHHHRVDQVVAAHVQELEHVVETGGVRAVFDHHRKDRCDVGAEQTGLAESLTGLHEVRVAHDGVDFTVVGDKAIRVSARPTREGVGGEAGVHQCQSRFEIGIMQIRKIIRKLTRRQHPLVDHGPGRESGHVEVVTSGEAVFAVSVDVEELIGNLIGVNGVAHPLADHIEPALKVHRIGDRWVATDEDLHDGRFIAPRGLAENIALDRNRAPADEFLAFLADDVLEQLLGRFAFRRVGGEEYQTGAVFAFRRKLNAHSGHLLTEKLVRHLNEYSGSVTRLRIRSACPSVVHLGVHRKGLLDDIV
ncbi:MAG: hypothetical protein BWY82_00590 [Verrucomicrobia bacterium ADurb.Bin474]|nr:MAG: hypothetical protein BWY82_00590 [Verrucomicrobia bacterium ADurb.Bin474]